LDAFERLQLCSDTLVKLEFAGPAYLFNISIHKILGGKIPEELFGCYVVTFLECPQVPFRGL
jgi:hypothetical protein